MLERWSGDSRLLSVNGGDYGRCGTRSISETPSYIITLHSTLTFLLTFLGANNTKATKHTDVMQSNAGNCSTGISEMNIRIFGALATCCLISFNTFPFSGYGVSLEFWAYYDVIKPNSSCVRDFSSVFHGEVLTDVMQSACVCVLGAGDVQLSPH